MFAEKTHGQNLATEERQRVKRRKNERSVSMEEQYKRIADCYAEEHGIIEYTVSGCKMTYYANYPSYLSESRRTYKIVVNLYTMKEESRTQLKRWNKLGSYNMYK